MDIGTLIQLATLISVVAGVGGLYISIRAYRRQVSAQFLLEYTRRADEIIQTLPRILWAAADLSPGRELPEQSHEVTLSVLRCLNIMSQMHYFTRRGYLPKSAWKQSQRMYARMLRSPLVVREWQTLGQLFVTNQPFFRYVEKLHRTEAPPPLDPRWRPAPE